MGWRDIFKRSLSTAEHVHFVDFVISQFFDWRSWAVFMITGLISYFGLPAIRDWSPLRITLTSIGVGGLCSLMYIGYAVFKERGGRHAESRGTMPAIPLSVVDPGPDIDAREAYFTILDRSEWRDQQLRTTTDTTHLVRNWLDVRLDDEIHKALVNSRLASWGEEVLPSGAMAPERPIPAETWAKVEIVFDRSAAPRTLAHWRVRGINQTGPIAWAGIKFSRQQAFRLFPFEGSAEWRPISKAVFHVARTIADSDFKNCYPEARRVLRQEAYNKQIRIRGRKQLVNKRATRDGDYSAVHTDIDNDYWRTTEINALATSEQSQTDYHTDPETAYAWGPRGLDERNRYSELLVNWPDIIRQWPGVPNSDKKIIAGKLDDLYAEGVGKRNRLIPAIPNFDLDRETAVFTEWNNRVLRLLDEDYISIAEKSFFRTLNLFHPTSAQAPDKGQEQHHLEAMWTEKLARLKSIIDRVGE